MVAPQQKKPTPKAGRRWHPLTPIFFISVVMLDFAL
jgi:hypothetical protein